MKSLLLTHDLSCVIGDLAKAASRYPHGAPMRSTLPARDLMVAAVAFTVQLAIDVGNHDSADMRALERELIAVLEDTNKPSAG